MLRGLARWIAERLPVEVVYFAVLRARRETVAGRWPGGEWSLRGVLRMPSIIITLN